MQTPAENGQYDILGLTPAEATVETFREAYRNLAVEWHPHIAHNNTREMSLAMSRASLRLHV